MTSTTDLGQSWDPNTLQSRYDEVRAYTETLAAPLSPEDQTVQSMPDVSPTKWHRAHVTWFFETFVLADNEPGFTPFQDKYWFLFNSYYEGIGPRYSRPDRGLISRPGAHDVGVYRGNVDDRMRDLLTSLDEGTLSKLASTIELGFHHEQQHQELLLMDIKHVLSRNPLQPAYAGSPTETAQSDALGWVEVDGGLVEVGHEGDGFCFDNELPRHEQWLRPFRIADRLVTNGEWMEFMADGGYRRHEFWLSDGWGKVQAGTEWDGAVLLDRGRRRVVRAHAPRHLAGQPGAAGQPRQLLRGRGLCDLGREAAAERGRVGARRAQHRRHRQPRQHHQLAPRDGRRGDRRVATDVRRLLGVDIVGLPPLSRLPPARRRDR